MRTCSLLVLLLCASAAEAGSPSANRSIADPADVMRGIYLSPGTPGTAAGSQLTVTVRDDQDQPLEGVEVILQIEADEIVWCENAVLVGSTDADGVAVLDLAGGGCVQIEGAAILFAAGVPIRAYDRVKSCDFDGASGNLRMELADLIKFGNEFCRIDEPDCHDYDNDGVVGLPDFLLFMPAFFEESSCFP